MNVSKILTLFTTFVCMTQFAVAADHANAAAAEAAPNGPVFKGTADLPGVVQIVRNFSDDRQAVTVIFRGLQTAVGGDHGALVETRSVTVSLPVQSEEEDAFLTQHIRGYVNVDRNARAVLVVQAAGKTTVVDLKKAQDQAKRRTKTSSSSLQQARKRAEAEAPTRPQENSRDARLDAEFFQELTGTVPAGAQYSVTFFLLVERDAKSADAGALLVVDSLDVELSRQKQAKK